MEKYRLRKIDKEYAYSRMPKRPMSWYEYDSPEHPHMADEAAQIYLDLIGDELYSDRKYHGDRIVCCNVNEAAALCLLHNSGEPYVNVTDYDDDGDNEYLVLLNDMEMVFAYISDNEEQWYAIDKITD